MAYLLFILYTFGIWIGDVFIFFGKLFSPKLDALYRGRLGTWKQIENFSAEYKNACWVHCASLGEFEQGRPLIEKIKLYHPDVPVLLSFYSPSGYTIMKDYDKVEKIIYLPSDLPRHNKKLISMIQPSMVIFVKYEFWWNLIDELLKQNIKIYLISGVFRGDDYFLKSFFKPFLALLGQYQKIFVQDELSAEILKNHGLNNISCVGDTRIDRVIQRSKSYNIPENIHEYCGDLTVIIYGSVWLSDVPIIKSAIAAFPHFRHIIAPHDVSLSNILTFVKAVDSPSDLYSDDKWTHPILFIDNIGMLSGLYKNAKYAYVGGGFQKGIHNILEPAVFGIPVFFGPNFKKFNEAVMFQNHKLGFSVLNGQDLVDSISSFEKDSTKYLTVHHKLQEFFITNKGATEKIASELDAVL
ncbi:MAG: hypothetical protein IPO92_03345 [Saprospiraceae bacterium]|nr:hypothetical protein [Saprospiraceae bacterium]